MTSGSAQKPDSVSWPPSRINYSPRRSVSGKVSGCVIASISHTDWLLFSFFFSFFFGFQETMKIALPLLILQLLLAPAFSVSSHKILQTREKEPELRRDSLQLISPVDSLLLLLKSTAEGFKKSWGLFIEFKNNLLIRRITNCVCPPYVTLVQHYIVGMHRNIRSIFAGSRRFQVWNLVHPSLKGVN